MQEKFLIYMWVAELVPLAATMFSFIYGLRHFFKKGKPIHLQCITMAMGSHALGSIYHLCQTLTSKSLLDGFTPAYLGHIGFFLFFIAASYGHLDRIVDDGTPAMKSSRHIAFAAPVFETLIYIPNFINQQMPLSTKITYALVWLPAIVSSYYNLKHLIIPDLDFGFVKAIKPYNLAALCLGVSELLFLTVLTYYMHPVFLVVSSFVFAGCSILTMIAAQIGVKKWTI